MSQMGVVVTNFDGRTDPFPSAKGEKRADGTLRVELASGNLELYPDGYWLRAVVTPAEGEATVLEGNVAACAARVRESKASV